MEAGIERTETGKKPGDDCKFMTYGDSKRRVPVLIGTRRIGRRSERVARFVLNGLALRDGIEASLIDLADVEVPLLRGRPDESASPPENFPAFQDKIAESHGLVIVPPEYKGGYPGTLKNAFDHLKAGIFRRKAIGIVTVSSGNLGGVSCLRAPPGLPRDGRRPIPATCPISSVDSMLDEAGNPLEGRLVNRLATFLDGWSGTRKPLRVQHHHRESASG